MGGRLEIVRLGGKGSTGWERADEQMREGGANVRRGGGNWSVQSEAREGTKSLGFSSRGSARRCRCQRTARRRVRPSAAAGSPSATCRGGSWGMGGRCVGTAGTGSNTAVAEAVAIAEAGAARSAVCEAPPRRESESSCSGLRTCSRSNCSTQSPARTRGQQLREFREQADAPGGATCASCSSRGCQARRVPRRKAPPGCLGTR